MPLKTVKFEWESYINFYELFDIIFEKEIL